MKHKLEIWKYTAYEYEEATAHLNDMAAKGWTLQDIATVWLPVACYEKDEAAASYRYTAEIVSETEDEDMDILCRDAGWERVLRSVDSTWIFRTRDENAKPLFADSAQRRETAWENYRNSSRPGMSLFGYILCIGVLAVMFYMVRDMENPTWHLKSMCYAFIALLACAIPSSLANYLWLKKSGENSGFPEAGRPGWLRRLSLAVNCIAILALLGILAAKGIEAAMTGNTIGVIWIALCPVLFLTGAYMKLALGWNIPGWIVMFAGVMAFFTDLSVFNLR